MTRLARPEERATTIGRRVEIAGRGQPKAGIHHDGAATFKAVIRRGLEEEGMAFSGAGRSTHVHGMPRFRRMQWEFRQISYWANESVR